MLAVLDRVQDPSEGPSGFILPLILGGSNRSIHPSLEVICRLSLCERKVCSLGPHGVPLRVFEFQLIDIRALILSGLKLCVGINPFHFLSPERLGN